jgi:cyclic pyranopterin phosphate synthase
MNSMQAQPRYRLKRIRYLRVSLLNSCNLNCFYCRPPSVYAKKSSYVGNFDKFKMALELLNRLGTCKVRFTGGEPTLYKRLPELIAFTRNQSYRTHIAITTNGRLLSRCIFRLAEAGLDSANISLDTLEPDKFRRITSVDCLDQVIAGIESAVQTIPKVKLNCVIMRGINDTEAPAMVAYANRLGVDIRFIEYMPTRHGIPEARAYIPGDAIKEKLPYRLEPVESEISSAARYWSSDDLRIRVGFISPVSHPFCAHCDRIRLTSDGSLYGCLFSIQAINLFELLEGGIDSIQTEIERLVGAKTYTGCCYRSIDSRHYPSFVKIGG